MAENKTLPSLFIGSSAEGIDIAREVELQLQDDAVVTIWKDGIFILGEGTLESLIRALDAFDFAILILRPDDLIEVRGERYTSPRDNVLFELGLFMGRLGPKRTLILNEHGADLKLPSDLDGIARATYRPRENLAAALSPACTPIIRSIRALGILPRPKVALSDPKFTTMAVHITNYLSANGFTKVSFERIRQRINSAYTDETLFELIDIFPVRFRRVNMKGGERGIGLVKDT